jgi:hypothetical protein
MALASGTGLAAAHVAGAAALLLESAPEATPGQVQRVLAAWGTGTSAGLLVYSFFAGDGVDEPPVPWVEATCRFQQHDCVFEASGSFDDGTIASYSWDFGDGETSTGKGDSTRHKYPADADLFTVTLTVTDDAGQQGSIDLQVALTYVP